MLAGGPFFPRYVCGDPGKWGLNFGNMILISGYIKGSCHCQIVVVTSRTYRHVCTWYRNWNLCEIWGFLCCDQIFWDDISVFAWLDTEPQWIRPYDDDDHHHHHVSILRTSQQLAAPIFSPCTQYKVMRIWANMVFKLHYFDYFYGKTNKMHQCIKFILFWNAIPHISNSLSVHHQELKTVHTATGICQTDTVVCLLANRQTVQNVWSGIQK